MIGDTNDFLSRLKATLPKWFGDSSPILDAVLSGYATAASFVYGLISYARLQTRIKTATDDFLDLLSADLFGATLPRKTNEPDGNFRARILINLLRERGTRNAITVILQALTGILPRIFEPWRPLDTGGYGIGGVGYGAGGAYGSLLLNNQVFITAHRAAGTGIPNVIGYGQSPGGYATPSQFEYASLAMIQGQVADADIYGAVENVRPVGTTAWVQIGN